MIYKYPPAQDKLPFSEVTAETVLPHDDRAIMARIAGISPSISRELLARCYTSHDASVTSVVPARKLLEILASIEDGSAKPRVYIDDEGTPREFHITSLSEFEELDTMFFDTVSECVDYYFTNRVASNMVRQKSMPLLKSVQTSLSKALLKKKRLSEDLL